MYLESLQVRNLRCVAEAEIAVPARGAWFAGANGAGKTSMLEAVALLGYGRSFRAPRVESLIRSGAPSLQIVASVRSGAEVRHTLGLRHHGDRWQARLDGVPVDSLSQLARTLPVLAFHPGSIALVQGPAEERRRSLDWLAFHVEPHFIAVSRQYARALRQRNALLRSAGQDLELDGWEQSLEASAERLTRYRQSALVALQAALDAVWALLSPEEPLAAMRLRSGWRNESKLADLLQSLRERDRVLGYTTQGPHRADIEFGPLEGVDSSAWSRGQAKRLALALRLAQHQALHSLQGQRSVLLLDDAFSEFDPATAGRLLDWLQQTPAQVLMTGVQCPPEFRSRIPDLAWFHVEQGRVRSA